MLRLAGVLGYFRKMPMFFFHLHECGDAALANDADAAFDDIEGIVLHDLTAAHEKAIEAARSVMADEVKHGRLCLGCRIEVTDDTGDLVLNLPFREAVKLSGL